MGLLTILSRRPAVKLALVSFSIMAIFGIVGASCLVSMYKITNRMYGPIIAADSIKNDFLKNDTVHKNIGVLKMNFLKMQYEAIGFAKQHHKETGRVYYANYYTFTVILSIATILTAILLIIIANNGWQKATPLAKVSFFTLFSISSFFGVMTATLGQKENYENNFKQYIFYDKVQNNILTFVNTSEKFDSVKSKNLVDSFIVAINSDLRNNNQFFMSIDASKISLDDISSKLGKSVNGGGGKPQ
ncbi:MAG: hypothetical protein U0V75_07860 [Ferruginibacter sp.]